MAEVIVENCDTDETQRIVGSSVTSSIVMVIGAK